MMQDDGGDLFPRPEGSCVDEGSADRSIDIS